MSYYSSDDDIDIRFRHGGGSASREVRYVQSPPRPRSYYGAPQADYLVPEHHTRVVTRSRSRSRGRRPSSPEAHAAQPAPVIINNRIYNDNDNSSDDESYRRSDRKMKQVVLRGSRSRSHERERPKYMTREDYEAEQVRKELQELRLGRQREESERRRQENEHRRDKDHTRNDFELQRAKQELDEIKAREAREAERKRVAKEIELKRLEEEAEAAREKQRRDKEAAEAVERYKQRELERVAREEKAREESEKEYKRRLTEDLVKSGLDEKAIAAIINKKKVTHAAEPSQALQAHPGDRPRYTRMARRHLSIETLRTYKVEFDLDQDPEYLIIKRWVPDWEQDEFWTHTRKVREKRSKILMIEEKKHTRLEPELQWVRKKERRRSKSPGVMVWLAGGRPT